jgi:F-type H+-transporting ATPase subunit c
MKFLKSVVLALGLLSMTQGAAFAQGASEVAVVAPRAPFSDLLPIGAGFVILSAAIGIGGLTKSAVESMARQPEASGDIRGAMVLSAALIEGVTFFALIILLLH